MQTSHTYKLAIYPKDVKLADGSLVVLKPMVPEDAGPLMDFFLRIPAEDRFYLKEDITSPEVIQRWVQELDYDRTLPLLAWLAGKVVGDGTLHHRRSGARRHVGELRVLVDPDFRNRGVGTTLMRELAEFANEHGLEHLVFEAVAEKEAEAIKAAEALGFIEVGVLRNHAKDLDGHPRDLVLLELPLGKWLEWWAF